MRVLLVHNHYRVPGGEERSVALLRGGLTRDGVDVEYWGCDSTPYDSHLGRIALAAGLAYRPSSAKAFRAVLDVVVPNIVHFHNILPVLTPSVVREAHRAGCGVIITMHNARWACPGGTLLRRGSLHYDCVTRSPLLCGLRNPRGNVAESLAYGIALEVHRRLHMLTRWSDALVAPSEYMAQLLVRGGFPPERVHMIHHGVPIPQRTQDDGDRGFVLYSGRVSADKGIFTLLAAAEQNPSIPVIVAGEGVPMKTRRVARGRVRFLGFLGAARLERLRRLASFGVVPSECPESFGYAAAEMAAAGKAVVASDIGALPELVASGKTGLLVPPGNVDELASAIAVLWKDTGLRQRTGRAAREFAEARFGLPRHTEALRSLYEKVLWEKSGRIEESPVEPSLMKGSGLTNVASS